MGPSDGPCEVIPTGATHEPAVRGADQRRGVARRRAGRRAQRLGVSSGDGGLPRGARRGAGRGRVGARPARRRPSPATKSAFASASSSAARITRSFIRPAPPARSRPPRRSPSLLDLDADATQHALGSAGTQAAGLWEFLRDGADSKQLHTAKAAADGLLSAYLARDGVTGARRILEGEQGLAAGMSTDADPSRLTDGLGTRWATIETSYKWHASCRHTHPAADALLALMERERLSHDQIARVTARVHQGAIDVLGQVTEPTNVHQAKFSMGTVLGLIAVHGSAGLDDFETRARRPACLGVSRSRAMVLDDEVDCRLSAPLDRTRWMSRRLTDDCFAAESTCRRAIPETRCRERRSRRRRYGSPVMADRRRKPRFGARLTGFGSWIRRIEWDGWFGECAKRHLRPPRTGLKPGSFPTRSFHYAFLEPARAPASHRPSRCLSPRPQAPRLHDRRAALADARHRSEHGGLQPRQRDSPPAARRFRTPSGSSRSTSTKPTSRTRRSPIRTTSISGARRRRRSRRSRSRCSPSPRTTWAITSSRSWASW